MIITENMIKRLENGIVALSDAIRRGSEHERTVYGTCSADQVSWYRQRKEELTALILFVNGLYGRIPTHHDCYVNVIALIRVCERINGLQDLPRLLRKIIGDENGDVRINTIYKAI